MLTIEIFIQNSETSKFTANFREEHFSKPDYSSNHHEKNELIRYYEDFNFSENGSSMMHLNEIKTMKSIWIPLFKVWLKSDQVKKITYQIFENNTNPTLPCQNYNLGKEILANTNVDLFYTENNQKEFFQDMTLPPIGSEGACSSEHKCLMKWLLLPSDQFQFGSSSTQLQCSNIPTIPIWSSTIENILRNVDEYLYTLSRISNKPLKIIAGVNQYLQLPNKQLGINNYVILVKEKNILAVPKIIYKIVQLKSTKCEDFKCWYSVLIVIHNGPYFSDQDRICEDMSESLGWDDIRYEKWSNEASKSKFIYVCPITEKTLEKVGLVWEKNSRFEELSLLHFPHFNEANQPLESNVKEKVFKELKRLSKLNEWSKSIENNKLIERPQIDDDDFKILEGKNDKKFIIITHRRDQPLSGV
ncbi:uncharacterized protein LOC135838876 isoform X2 [Planococcus citri]|uniref:uncharacterized protein LOC135838876 isoform X2 n=1 Tax=Planococcus citri TaxID=170843 RepID=UPI0031F90BE8